MADGSVQVRGPRPAPRVRVRYNRPTKRNTRYPVLRLPFVGKAPSGEPDFWLMPAADGYGAGCEMGRAAAQAYMKALRAEDVIDDGALQRIVMSIVRSGHDFADAGRRGQIIGFFSYLGQWLSSAAAFGSRLDAITEADVEAAMTLAANETQAEHDARMAEVFQGRRQQGGP